MKRVMAQSAKGATNVRSHVTIALVCLAGFVAMFYAYNLYTLISRTVAIGQIEKKSAELSMAISSLDSEYLQLSNSITPDRLSSYGLTSGHVSMYINRPSRTASIGNLASGGHEL